MAEDPDGLVVLRKLLSGLQEIPTGDHGYEDSSTRDYPCGVPGCSRPAVFRCDAGFRYCAHDAKSHGEHHAKHEFSLITSTSSNVRKDAATIIRGRIAATALENARDSPDDG